MNIHFRTLKPLLMGSYSPYYYLNRTIVVGYKPNTLIKKFDTMDFVMNFVVNCMKEIVVESVVGAIPFDIYVANCFRNEITVVTVATTVDKIQTENIMSFVELKWYLFYKLRCQMQNYMCHGLCGNIW